MKLLFDLKFLTILYKNYQFDTIPFQNEIMTFQDLIIVQNLFFITIVLDILYTLFLYTLFFLFASLFFKFFERSRFLQSNQKKDRI